ncbi:MAG: ethylbenzene dehydrogenase-related protein [Bradyrhizobium sp.]|uniref:ethylbenzene dehydrogenase-related protein n=1 Tax=Bradyrhizobium sp. TaxID=376 RepID=UPI002A3460DE|nr:cytochrome b/b6 domain-containing protein [Bradyrhizobium sp.]
MKERRTDYGTIVLHWLLVASLGVAFVTGLRIATETPGRQWLNVLDAVLPRANVWVPHMQAALVLVALTLAYVVYLFRSGLTARVRLDRIRLSGLLGKGQVRIRSLSVVLTWGLFAALAALIASGGMLYFGVLAGYGVAMVHWCATWAIPALVALHVLVHAKFGGLAQLLRIVRPSRLSPPPPPLDAAELLVLLAEQSARLQPEAARETREEIPATEARLQPEHPAEQSWPPHPVRRRPRRATLQANPLIVAVAVALAGVSLIVAGDRLAVDQLHVHRIASADAPLLDGDTSDRVWRNIAPVTLATLHGDNFDGKGEARIEIRAVNDGTWAYFLFTWNDPTRSLKHLPLIKRADGWHLLHNGFENGDERDFNEDKFSVLFTRVNVILAGDRTFHASPQPLADKPATMSGRGLHYKPEGIGPVDVWLWKATSGGPSGWMEDGHFGTPAPPTPQQESHLAPYKGGYAPDPGRANYSDNFIAAAAADASIVPRRLPRDLAAMNAAMGEIDLDPDHGESIGSRWFMTEAESLPFSAELDARVPVGAVIPGVIVSGEFSGDRADIRCAARWASGHWSLEVARRLDTGSPHDVAIASGAFMRVAAFDHNQIGHTRHVRPVRLKVD